MQARAPLMIEHRLIERMIVQIKRVLPQIEKEDKIFFPSARMYFSEQEDQAMLNEFWEFDRKMIHEKYISVVEAFNNQ